MCIVHFVSECSAPLWHSVRTSKYATTVHKCVQTRLDPHLCEKGNTSRIMHNGASHLTLWRHSSEKVLQPLKVSSSSLGFNTFAWQRTSPKYYGWQCTVLEWSFAMESMVSQTSYIITELALRKKKHPQTTAVGMKSLAWAQRWTERSWNIIALWQLEKQAVTMHYYY